MTTLCTFNVNNLFLRYNFSTTFAGDMSGKSGIAKALWGYLPMQKPGKFEVFNEEQRTLEEQVLRLPGGALPDILCLQEVESLAALRLFNEHYLNSYYPYAALLDSRDMRQIDVGILSARPILNLTSNVDTRDPQGGARSPWLFSRDCLEVELALDAAGKETLTVFLNHFKSKLAQGKTPAEKAADAQRSADKRLRQAEEVVRRLKLRFPGTAYDTALFAVVGDLNDEPGSPPVQHLVREGRLENVLDRLPQDERWTHYYKSGGQVSQFDYLLLSPALSKRCTGARPLVNRAGLGGTGLSKRDQSLLPHEVKLVGPGGDILGKVDFTFPRLKGVGAEWAASDHCPLALEF